MNKSDIIERKYIETINIENYEILTDLGWSDLTQIMKTVPYTVWRVKTLTHELECADTHILFDQNLQEVFVKDLLPGDLIYTESGVEPVLESVETSRVETMYDVSVGDKNHRFYSNGILSHNSMVLGNIAARSFLIGNMTGLVTVELPERQYMKRIGSNILNIPSDVYSGITDAHATQIIMTKIAELKEKSKTCGELIIKDFPTGSATAIDMENYFLRLESKMNRKFKVIVVDYLNLLRPIKDQNGLYEKIKCISEELRGVAMRNEWCIISATQVKREAIDNFDLGMDSVAESFGLIHTVDSLFGLMRSPLDSRMKIKIIANRDNGYEESYKFYAMVKDYFRLTEEVGQNSEFYSDDEEVNKMQDELRTEYSEISEKPAKATTISEEDYDALFNSI